ncbi:DUF2600 family protein [Conexibacter arvalis]|uniref:Tetraprenyl-beta-curcumene synthase n=1 Tax=Conexibacter arvalis TaxID=912552 RepID=A0A840ILJ4_9ACTN|nr:DUF2600 family protein [Conexibacter arvalis]MBB4664770.1 tetraprenyl-beta-curcumene synthase [Conexibacter arvalis]
MTDLPVTDTAGQRCSSSSDRRSLLTLLWATPLYWLRIFPAVTRELRRWQSLAQQIPDPQLRALALAKLSDERASAEGAAAFAILAARRRRLRVTRACVAFEVLYDYLDALGEAHPTLANNRRLHAALTAAVDADHALGAFYDLHPHSDDGGYLDALVLACRTDLGALPNTSAVASQLREIALRSGEAQSRNHATLTGDDRLRDWASDAAADWPELEWFEFAAGAGSPLGVFALVAVASHPRTSGPDAAAVADAYFPWVAALHWLMESVVDHADDLRTGNPSYVARYGSGQAAADRLAVVAARSARDLAALPHQRRHRLLLAGMVALNLVHDDARHELARGVATTVRAAIGPAIAPFLVMLRARGAAKQLRRFRRRRPAAAGSRPHGRR